MLESYPHYRASLLLISLDGARLNYSYDYQATIK